MVGGIHNLTTFDFELLPRASREGKYQGFTPDDVIYLLMPDRFADGDPSNPPNSNLAKGPVRQRRLPGQWPNSSASL